MDFDLPDGAARRVISDISQITTRNAANTYLRGLNLTKPMLLALARRLHVAVYTTDNKDTVLRQIIDATAGVREDAAAIRSPRWR
jgi:hypothetical protein